MSERKLQVTFVIDDEIDAWIRQARAAGCNTSVLFRKILHEYINRHGGGQYATMAFEVTTNDTK
jgi:hypothetical protein